MKWQVAWQWNYSITVCDEKVAQAIHNEIGCYDFDNYEWKYKKFVKNWKWHNLVPLVARNKLADKLSWYSVSEDFVLDYVALWDDATTPNNNDTTLWNETLRWAISDIRRVSNIVYVDKFFWSADVGWNTYREVGIFSDATITTDSWLLWSKIAINETLSATETLTINASITFT